MQLLPTPIWQGDGVTVLQTREGDAVVRAAGDAVLVPEQIVALALAILGAWSPECCDAIERHVRASRLRLVHGGEPGPGGNAA